MLDSADVFEIMVANLHEALGRDVPKSEIEHILAVADRESFLAELARGLHDAWLDVVLDVI